MKHFSSFLMLCLTGIMMVGCTQTASSDTASKNKETDKGAIIVDESLMDITYGAVKSVKSVCYYAHEDNGTFVKDRIMPNYAVFMAPQTIRQYDKDGNIVLLEYFNAVEKYRTVKKTYENGKITSSLMYDEDGELEEGLYYTYQDGKLVKFEKKEQYDSPNYKEVYTITGDHVTRTDRYYNDEYRGSMNFVYENDLRLQEVEYNAQGEEGAKACYTYNEQGQGLSSISYYKGKARYKGESAYNEDYLITRYYEGSCISDNSLECHFNYLTFDDHGNWLTRTIHIDGVEGDCIFEERTIEYYQ